MPSGPVCHRASGSVVTVVKTDSSHPAVTAQTAEETVQTGKNADRLALVMVGEDNDEGRSVFAVSFGIKGYANEESGCQACYLN